ncbi:hypothetical protein [Niabella aurantiaca]|uniref:hypothetical protein n=1 Tax=Niabella aurantiaca TaxID=379900 RepID=UPI0012F97C64|nr:hypothetical protein [Niabella aurantiaca]
MVSINFRDTGRGGTVVELCHTGFENHGEEAASYARAMDAGMGWEYILRMFADYAVNCLPPA